MRPLTVRESFAALGLALVLSSGCRQQEQQRAAADRSSTSAAPGAGQAQQVFCGDAKLFEPGVISTDRTEVRLTISPDGTRMLWGTIGWSGGPGGSEKPGGLDIWERRRNADGTWTTPAPASFATTANDFDPSFAPDGSAVYFFSNRPGGHGGDDLYVAPLDRATSEYLPPRNLGPTVNSAGDEFAPVLDAQGNLLFATNGRGGRGGHDLFLARRSGDGWSTAEPLTEANSSADDFDATFLPHDDRIVFAVGDAKGGRADLHLSERRNGTFGAPQRLGAMVNAPDTLNFGPSVSAAAPGVLFFSSHRAAATRGRIDIYRIALCEPR